MMKKYKKIVLHFLLNNIIKIKLLKDNLLYTMGFLLAK
jgi:hypothetical protein